MEHWNSLASGWVVLFWAFPGLGETWLNLICYVLRSRISGAFRASVIQILKCCSVDDVYFFIIISVSFQVFSFLRFPKSFEQFRNLELCLRHTELWYRPDTKVSIVSKTLNNNILACGPLVCLKFVRVAVRGILNFVSFWVGRAF